MDSLLSISSTKTTGDDHDGAEIQVVKQPQLAAITKSKSNTTKVESASEVLNTLRDKPSFESLRTCLKWLIQPRQEFNIKVPGPVATQTISVLVNDILPSHWTLLSAEDYERERQWFLNCLRSLAGINALVARIRLSNIGKSTQAVKPGQPKDDQVLEIVEALSQLLKDTKTITIIWQDIDHYVEKPIQRQILWKELIALLASGRLLSSVAEATLTFDQDNIPSLWLADGEKFAAWLGSSISMLASSNQDRGNEVFPSAASMLGRALSLGQNDHLLSAAFRDLLWGGDVSRSIAEQELFRHLSSREQPKVLAAILSILNKRFISTSKKTYNVLIAGTSALVRTLCIDRIRLQEFLIDWLACVRGGCVGSELGIRRAVIAALSSFSGQMQAATKTILTQFADKLHIQHAPVLLQEVCTQNLLLLFGRIFRSDSNLLKTIVRSSIYINAISNRLAASAERPRFLGMVVGMALSELVDPPEKRMKFSLETMTSPDKDWYMELTGVQDRVGRPEDLKSNSQDLNIAQNSMSMPKLTANTANTATPRKRTPTSLSKTSTPSRIIAIEEVSDSEADELPHFNKPDSDASDSDDDPTVINRNKPTPPVYVRDLLIFLRDTDNYERHSLAMSHAAALIRRKSNYGTEVTDHLDELATLLCGLKDEHDIEDWQQQRMAAMIAIILAQPTSMGKWFSANLFKGDYSVSQRAAMLTALTLAARELAGYAAEDSDLTRVSSSQGELFPSKYLPPKYAKLYSKATAPLDAAAKGLESMLLTPLAVSAAENAVASAGPSILKTKTFSTRMTVEARRKPINNRLSTLLAEDFFYPLLHHYRAYHPMHGNSLANVWNIPFLQAHYLKTLALLLAAAGPSTLALPRLTSEFWSLLLSNSARVSASEALPVLEALLFGLLTLLDVNGAGAEGEDSQKRRLAEDHGEEIVETQRWVGLIMERIGVGELGQEEEKVRMLAAGVLIRADEITRRYQRLLFGILAGS